MSNAEERRDLEFALRHRAYGVAAAPEFARRASLTFIPSTRSALGFDTTVIPSVTPDCISTVPP